MTEELVVEGGSEPATSINEAMDEAQAAAASDILSETDDVDRLAMACFAGKIVRKDLTALMKRGANVPTFVLEYLLGMYCSTNDEEAVRDGLERIRSILTNNFVRPEESEAIKSKIRELGQYTIIDKVRAYLDEHQDIYVAEFTNLSIEPFVLPAEYARQYTKILQGGIWCIMRIQYAQKEDEDDFDDIFGEAKPKKKSSKKGPQNSPFGVVSLTPIQMPNLDLDEMIANRSAFTTEQWEALLLRSAGYEPTVLSERQRLHFLERMVPLIERNYNLCELGPRGTGKSHVYKEVSPYAILLSGGQTTTANLFGHMSTASSRRNRMGVGLVGLWDCITFDEVAGMRFKDANAVQIMKDYMASGSYARGRDQINADASIVLEGNINDTVENVLKVTHLFDPFPEEFNNDSAYFDRIHCYLPGWEIPKMRSDLLTEHYGLITDCLSEFCKEMRKRDFTHVFNAYFRLNADFNKRDETAVRKTFSGMAKLLFPDGQMAKDEVRRLLEYAIEGRRRVKEQLKTMAGVEFMDVNLGYIDIDNPSDVRVVTVPEQSDEVLIAGSALMPGHVYAIGQVMRSSEYAVYRLENRAIPGEFKLQTEGIGYARPVREAMEAAFRYFEDNARRVAAGMRIASKDYLLFFNDLQEKGLSDEVSLAEFIGLCSAAANRPVASSLVIPGVLRLSGTLEPLDDLEDIMRVAKNAGAKKVLLPMGCIKDLQDIPAEFIGAVSPEFYPEGDAVAAAQKALEL
ncbi:MULTISPECIES: protease Lon-related BREX system protein BrxL [Adlercreutzia]|uniref:protease Lon-related BREX system protein BrxL n=1 Tax=Adlercreutzia TaxID=447020 RepID=UPI002570D9C8|nr:MULTISPECIES: protease Lon-related BREX system protein BrxL [Adlercreutzia]MEB1812893.1 protease Lon-related BREX system protein BrxL [Adlercreutzia mucosicola]